MIRIPLWPRPPQVDADKLDEIEQKVRENERRIQRLQQRLQVAEIRLGIQVDDDAH